MEEVEGGTSIVEKISVAVNFIVHNILIDDKIYYHIH